MQYTWLNVFNLPISFSMIMIVMNHKPLFMVSSWNKSICCMSLWNPVNHIIPTVWLCFRMSVWYRQHLSMSAYMMWLGSALRMSAIILHFIKNIKVLSLAKRWPSPEGSYNIKTILSCIRYPITHIKWPWNILMFIIRVISLVGCLHIATFNQGPGLLRNFHVKIHELGLLSKIHVEFHVN